LGVARVRALKHRRCTAGHVAGGDRFWGVDAHARFTKLSSGSFGSSIRYVVGGDRENPVDGMRSSISAATCGSNPVAALPANSEARVVARYLAAGDRVGPQRRCQRSSVRLSRISECSVRSPVPASSRRL